MSDPFDPHADKRRAAADAATQVEAEERARLQSLIESEPGRWLLSRILNVFETEVRRKCTGHNSEDSYHRGIQDLARDYRDLLIKHFGHAAIDKILKGKS